MCTRPLTRIPSLTGGFFFKRINAGYINAGDQVVPCGRCIACQIHYIRVWTGRCMAENLMRPYGHFVTLTYRPDVRPDRLIPLDLCNFLKRARYHMGPFRYYAVGEYGEQSQHPHFHLCFWPENPIRFGVRVRSNLWTSPDIEKAWELGHVSTSQLLETGSIRYVVGYVQKKLRKHEYISEDGEILTRPFARQSQSLGLEYYLADQNAIARNGFVVIKGRKYPICKDLIKKFTQENRELIESKHSDKFQPTTEQKLAALDENLNSQKRKTTL